MSQPRITTSGSCISHTGRYLAAAEAFEQAIRARPTFTAAKTRAHDARMRVLTNR